MEMKMASALLLGAIVCAALGASRCHGAVIADSPSPASQPSGAGARPPVARQMDSSTIDDLMSALARVTKSKDELRCYCNLPVCVTTGYMCKSPMGTCFTEIVDRSDLSKSRHGCLELLATSDKPAEVCHQAEHQHNSHAQHHHRQRPLVLCCQDDLCNYGSQHVQLRLYAGHPHGAGTGGQRRINDSATTGLETRSLAVETRLLGGGGGGGGADGPTASGNVGHDLWLKAATIAVPIAGGCILVLLVLMAMRMLRRDRENNNITVLGSGGYSIPAQRIGDLQIRAKHQLPSRQWGTKDRQPMLPSQPMNAINSQRLYAQYYEQHQSRPQQQQQCAPLLPVAHQHNIVYMPTVQKIVSPKRMWNLTKPHHQNV